MKIKILGDCISNKKTVKAGSIIDVSDKEAKILIVENKAEKVSGEVSPEIEADEKPKGRKKQNGS